MDWRKCFAYFFGEQYVPSDHREGTDVTQKNGDDIDNAYAFHGLCPECFSPVETECKTLWDKDRIAEIEACKDFCIKCEWESNEYYA